MTDIENIGRDKIMKDGQKKAIGMAAAAVGISAAAAIAVARAGRDKALRQVAAFDHQVTGVTVSEDGRIFVNFPRWTEDAPISVAELMPDGALKAYPDEAWNSWRNEKQGEISVERHFVCVQSVVADGRGSLWVLDPAAPGNEKILEGGPKLVQVDLATDSVKRVIPVPGDVALQGTYLNDVRFSPDGNTAYITDSGTRGAIIVIDLDSGEGFRALDGHKSTQVEPGVVVTVDGHPLRRPDKRQPAFAADGIALSRDGETLYWQALTGKTLYKVPTEKLTKNTDPAEIEKAVEEVGTTHVADGLWISRTGVLYITSPTDNAVTRWTGETTEPVVQDKRLRWPDTMSEGPDGTIYVTASHIQDTSWFKPLAPPAIKTALYAFSPEDGGVQLV